MQELKASDIRDVSGGFVGPAIKIWSGTAAVIKGFYVFNEFGHAIGQEIYDTTHQGESLNLVAPYYDPWDTSQTTLLDD